jgi:hypothetical protein
MRPLSMDEETRERLKQVREQLKKIERYALYLARRGNENWDLDELLASLEQVLDTPLAQEAGFVTPRPYVPELEDDW